MITPASGWIVDPNNPNGVIQAPAQQMGVRNLQIQSGDPAAILGASRSSAQTTGSSVPSNATGKFGELLMGLLQRHQGLGTAQFAQQGFNAQQQQNNTVLAQTPDSLIGAAPGVQAGVRNAAASSYDPTIQGARQSAQTFAEQIKSYGDTIGAARQMIQDYQSQQDKARDDARSVILNAFTIGGADSLKGLDSTEIAQLEKNAGYPKGYIEGVGKTLKERELALKQQTAAASLANAEQVKLTASQKTARDTLDAVLTSLDSYKNLYSRLVGSTGVKLTGPDAGSLSGAYNTLIFLIAQAAGTGALQAADREVVEAMIPNPTSVSGAIGGSTKGGREGGINAIDQARAMFVNKKNSIGGSAPAPQTAPTTNTTSGVTSSGIKYTITR